MYFKEEQLSSWHYHNYHATTLLVQIQLGSDQWSVYKRYSNFRQFHEEIKKKYPQVYICDKICAIVCDFSIQLYYLYKRWPLCRPY